MITMRMMAVIHSMREERRESLERGEDAAMWYHRNAMQNHPRFIPNGLCTGAVAWNPEKIVFLGADMMA